MRSSKSAVRYAKALLELAIEKNKVDVVENNVNSIIRASQETSDFSAFLNSPLIKVDKKISVLNELFGDFDSITLDFLSMVTKNGRENLIMFIANSFVVQLKEFRGIVPITIVSARQLESATRNKILAKIQKMVHGTPEITEKTDESLIGGFIIRMGDQQIDASVASQLMRLKQELIK
ncbi:MAG: ATP synthase F1 subunit delta [Bacteroidetes bacterium]|nr:ATP synthase F1 subunit delta [Bacteroidota bacterium]